MISMTELLSGNILSELPQEHQDRRFYIYTHIDPITLKVRYIGKGTNKRAYNFYNRSRYYRNWVGKLRQNNLKPIVKILISNLSEDIAYIIEKKVIACYKKIEPSNLINFSNGGAGGKINKDKNYKHSEETRKLISLKSREAHKNSPYMRCKGSANPMYGKFGPAHHLFRTKVPQERIERFRKVMIGRKSLTATPIICTNTKQEFSSIHEASIKLNIHRTPIDKVLKGTTKTAGGLNFKYKNKENVVFISNAKPIKKVVCLETMEEFDSAEQVAANFNRKKSNLYSHI